MNYLVKVSFLCLLELFLQEQNDFLHISRGSHAQHDANCFTSDLHIGTGVFSFSSEKLERKFHGNGDTLIKLGGRP